MRRSIMIVLIALLALAMAAPLAFAQSNGGAPEPNDDPGGVLPPLSDPTHIAAACEFPVRYESSGFIKEIDLPARPGEVERTITIFPASSYTLTNEVTGKQVTLNTTGAQHQTTLANGDVVTVVTGLNLQGDPEAGFVLAKGKFSYVFDQGGNLIQPLEGTGELIDVCELLS